MEFDIDEKAKELNFDYLKQGGTKPKNVKDEKDTGDGKKFDYSKFKKTEYSEAEIEKLLEGYDEVPEGARYSVPKGSHVRYLLVSGDFRRGGYVQNAYQLKGKPTLHLETKKDPKEPGYSKWPLVLEDVKVLWKKRTSEDARVQEVREHTNQSLSVAFDQSQQLEMRMTKLEENVQKILMFLGRKFGNKPPTAASPATGVGTKVQRNL